MMRYRNGDERGLAGELEDIAHPAAPLLAYAIAQTHRGGAKGEASCPRRVHRAARNILRHLGSNIWVLELIGGIGSSVRVAGNRAWHDCRLSGRRSGRWWCRYCTSLAGIWEALLTTPLAWLSPCHFPFSPPFSTMPSTIRATCLKMRSPKSWCAARPTPKG